MRRSGAAQQSLSVSLFPFLAVLICTMGALIVLLVVISRQATLQAAEESAEESDSAPSVAEIRGEIELIESDIALLEQQSRPLTEEQLHDQRHRLAVTEQLIRDLRDRYEQLKRDAERAAGFIDDGATRQRDLQQRLDQLRRQLAEATEQLDKARREANNKPRSYSVVPYRGPNGTRRRPIYIECRRDRVILQPEGVVLKQSDFEEPLGPGNPLAAALRATREYWADGGRVDQQGERAPYPLILVRPDGAISFPAVRGAIKSWGPDFGYELIDRDWKLDFPPADPALAAAQRRAIEDARENQKRLRLAAPARYRNRDRTPFRLERAQEISNLLLGLRRGGPNEGRGPGRDPRRSGTGDGADGSPTSPTGRAGGSGDSPRALADARGADWALPPNARGSTPVTRPIHVVCERDRISLLPIDRRGRPKVIPLQGATARDVDRVVEAIQQRVETWGIAGKKFYWRPVLKLVVRPGGEGRANDLRILLRDSGIGVE